MKKIIDQLTKLNYSEKVELLEALKSAIAEELAKAGGEPRDCPWCGSNHFVKKGRGPDGSQRWLCRRCAKTSSARSGGLLARSKLPVATWMAFAGCTWQMLCLCVRQQLGARSR